MKKVILLFTIFALCINLSGQTGNANLTGRVSFVSSQNIYVKFKNTSGISSGDTLFITSGGKLVPVLKVNNLSTTSCICSTLSNEVLAVDHIILARIKSGDLQPSGMAAIVPAVIKPGQELPDTSAKTPEVQKEYKQIIRGSLSVHSYSDFSNTIADNSQRFRYTFSVNAKNIGDSRFSVDSYISFKHKAGEWEEVKNDLFNALKIYSLSVNYDLNKTTRFSLGRKINYRISSLGPTDGLQVEKTVKQFAFGAVAGTRPDYATYGFNKDLLQYGAYVAYSPKAKSGYNETSVAFMQQMNSGKTDRRFLYFQHSSSFIRNLSLFTTFELDLYKLNIDTVNNTQTAQSVFDPTGLYASLTYRISRNFTLTGSYDARKNVIYYETYKTYFDRILENEMRQSYRLQASIRITNNITLGLQSGYRSLKSDPHPAKNANGYLTYSQIPVVKISATLSGTYLETSYMNGYVIGLNLTRDFLKGIIQAGAGYKYVDYTLPENDIAILQNVAEVNLNLLIAKTVYLGAYYEGTFEPKDKYNRIYLQLRKRF